MKHRRTQNPSGTLLKPRLTQCKTSRPPYREQTQHNLDELTQPKLVCALDN
jgi:hypothetical protein